ncbi:hypothetical protein BTM25_37320 [Actinomadura rubteroloni]|uniref:DUF8129 domain-containing protein n=1 Tax=Actinomadura rubteroloni TaxID=1926885 RepID=A0A2P4UJ80_9ACTN|nr:hypothetical protein [Actinomadura rubteroloni]POM25090.1 hypothetical protein BTM25_37320 [Actinomadura rubteroloni]
MTRSPRRIKQVRDTVGEQFRDLPLHAVRLAMFGVGRALLLSDRVTQDYKEITEGGGVRPVLGRLRGDVQHTAGKVVGQVTQRVRGGEDESEPAPARRPAPRPDEREIAVGKPGAAPAAKPAPEPGNEAAPRPAPKPTPSPSPVPEPGTEVEPAPSAEVEPAPPAAVEESGRGIASADLPVPDYDAATIPQLRARLRGLSVEQVKLLREYERTHAARPDVVRMYENRIIKLNGQG